MRTATGITGIVIGLSVALLLAGCSSGPASGGARPGTSPRPSATAARDARPAAGALDTRTENARPGSAGWRLTRADSSTGIAGYADRVSVRPGRAFGLYVSTSAPRFAATAYRMGWYAGTQGRELWHAGGLVGHRQAAPTLTRATDTVSARWHRSVEVRTTGWPAGDYLVKLESSRGDQAYVPITVRSTSTRGTVVLLNSVATWQAYNTWGGYDLYLGPRGFADRSRAVSFDRPYDRAGIGRFLSFERPVVALAERLGLRLSYVTDTDLAADPGLLRGARAVVTLGHAEYWSLSMRRAVTAARDRGTNVAFLGANAVNRHVRFAATALGPDRLVICYKSATEDPDARTRPVDSTQDWRLAPDPRPESALTGVLYDCFPADQAFVVRDPDSWLLAGTGVRAGTRFAGLVGPEADRLDLADPTPRPIEVLSDESFGCDGRRTWSNAAYYTVPSGAAVFDAGTMRWVPALGHSARVTPSAWRFVGRVTARLLRAFAAGPCGRRHPAHDNARAYAHGT